MALEVSHEAARKLVRRNLDELAPKMCDAVRAAVEQCEEEGYAVYVYEVLRTHELARMYYELGSSKARDGWKTWHFYGLAVDVIHPKTHWKAWDNDVEWRRNVVRIFRSHGLDWGGAWVGFVDPPHFQWGRCRNSPSSHARELYEQGGAEAVWREVGAL